MMETNEKRKLSTRRVACAAVAGAAYAALTMLLYPISYGTLQFRLSEALCVLPFFDSVFVPGLFVGCLIANLISTSGPLDVIFGSLATLLAALGTAACGRRSRRLGSCALGCLFPVVTNGVIVGAVLAATVAAEGETFTAAWLLYGGEVALGEAAVLYAVGLPLARVLQKKNFLFKMLH